MTNTFLKKLYKSNKIDLVQPNENIKDAYLNKSDDYLDTAKLCVDNDKLEQSVSMSYYSMYYSVLALLFNTGIKSEVHTASILILNKVYGLDDSKISFAKTERVDKQYFIDFSIAKEESEELIEMAQEFNALIFDFISKISNENIQAFRNKFKLLIGL